MKKHRNHLKDHTVSWEEMAPGALVCPGSWRLRTSQGWALGEVTVGPTPARTHVAIVMTSGKRVRRLSGEPGSRALREMGTFPAGNGKRGGEWQKCHLFASVFFLNLMLYWEGGSVFYFQYSICWIQTLGWAEQTLGMYPWGAESQVGKKDIK